MYYEDVLEGTSNIQNVHKVVVSLSGGLDSTTLLYLMIKKFGKENVFAVSFSYNQRHDVELYCAKETTKKLGVYHKVIDIRFLGDLVKDISAMVKGTVKTPTMDDLAAQKDVPTYVPFRNAILSSIVLAFAETMGADGVALGVQYGDYANNDVYHYWDTTPKFTTAMQYLADLNDKHSITYLAPFGTLTKADEIRIGQELGVDFSMTNTCYDPKIVETKKRFEEEPAGGRIIKTDYLYKPCGICPSCVGRAEAFKSLNLIDPVYEGVIVE